jgi:hypothetical protein
MRLIFKFLVLGDFFLIILFYLIFLSITFSFSFN